MTDDIPHVPTSPERIAKVIARSGVASRRDAEKMILEGRVSVNGKKTVTPAINVLPTDRVTIDGRAIDAPQETRLWLYYKPLGLITSEKDEQGRRTVFDEMPQGMPRVLNVGRLDLNSEGLLLLTNDGGLKRRLELPETGWLRKYRVRVNGRPDSSAFDPLRAGITIDGEDFQPMEIELDRQQGANAWLTVGIREGKNREIRRAMNEIGLMVNRLIRVSYGPFRLNEMNPGDVVEIKKKMLRDQLGDRLLYGLEDGRESRHERREASQALRQSRYDATHPRHDAPNRFERPGGKMIGDDRGTDRGARPSGDRPRRSSDDKSAYGERPRRDFGDKPSYGDKPRRDFGDKPARPGYGDKPRASRDEAGAPERKSRWSKSDRGAERPQSGDRPAYGDKPRRDFGDKPSYGDKPRRDFGDKPSYGDKPRRDFGDKPSYGDKPRRDFGDKPSYGDKPRRDFGDKPAYGDKPRRDFGDKPSYGDKPRGGYGGKPAGDKPGFKSHGARSHGGPAGGGRAGGFKSHGDRPAGGGYKPRGGGNSGGNSGGGSRG
ncbi:pseudouridine synthase [Albirhodobacter sp. R86504]|uniref:pseudouridine synthase n=1 Tax=Albirhodobacter sp. R86504 TaxID=3093848 RepID=UPI00366B765F